jgi:hypothetical protein
MRLMVSIPCGTCGEPIFPGVASCPHCGATNRVDVKVMTQRLLTVLGALLGLGLLTLLCGPQTKTLECKPTQNGGNGPQAISTGDMDASITQTERFSIDTSSKLILFPGSKEIKAERIPYVVNGNILTFKDRFGVRFVLDLNSRTLRSFAKASREGRYRLSATATCSGI